MIYIKTQAQRTDQLKGQVCDQIHLTTVLEDSAMESAPVRPAGPAATLSTQPWAILDLGQLYTFWDSISPFLCAGFLLLYSSFQSHLISHTPHGPASLDYLQILSQPTLNGNVTMKYIPFNIIHLLRFLLCGAWFLTNI